MDAFAAQQQDEGYSEDPLNQSAANTSLKLRDHGASTLGAARSSSEFPEWFMRHVAGLTVQEKTGAYYL